jgi:hypothetical protein
MREKELKKKGKKKNKQTTLTLFPFSSPAHLLNRAAQTSNRPT